MEVFHVFTHDFDRDGRPELLVNLFHVNYFPGILLRIDPRTGSIEARYDHPGNIVDLKAADFTGDGVDEIIARGSNNAYNRAFFDVLPWNFMPGTGPARGVHIPSNRVDGTERLYALLPIGPLGRQEPWPNHAVNEIRLQPADTLIRLRVQDAVFPGTSREASLFYYLNFDLQPTGVGAMSLYERGIEILFDQRRYPYPYLNHRIRDSLMREFRYWDGQDWRQAPSDAATF